MAEQEDILFFYKTSQQHLFSPIVQQLSQTRHNKQARVHEHHVHVAESTMEIWYYRSSKFIYVKPYSTEYIQLSRPL